MNILVIGNGGREHALVWKLKQSQKIKNIFVAPGNAGTGAIAQNIPLSKTSEIMNWLYENKMDMVLVGPDNYLEEGIVDMLEEKNIPVFGPSKMAAKIEWSKAFAKELMKKENIPTASYEIFSNLDNAKEYVRTQKFPLVIKASGLALGKGVIIANGIEEALDALDKIMQEKIFGGAGNEVVIEEYLQGKEISIHAFCDGKDAVLFPAAQDHKRIFENDLGLNTGGMGTIAPVPWVTDRDMQSIKEKIVMPLLLAMQKMNSPFKGLLFPGVMITENGPKVIEFNARFGDPETQTYMRILETDLIDILFACVENRLEKQEIKWSGKSACTVVCASGGYPGNYEKEKVITGLEKFEKNEEVVVFHAGTKIKDGRVVTNGGRVLALTATGDDLNMALNKAYSSIREISFEGMQFRKDIGAKSI